MDRKIIYLINPISGTKGKSSLKDSISRATQQQGIAFEILHTSPTGDYRGLRERIINEKITDIVICGGDGSVSAVSGALMGTAVKIGIIPMGSGNGLALCAGIPRNTAKALDIIFNGRASYIDGFYINDQFSCMLCGIGLDAQVAHEFAEQKRRGLGTYIKITLKDFFTCRSYPFEIITDGQQFSTDAFFISVANSNQFGNNFKIAPRASLSDGLLDIVIVKKMNKIALLFAVFKQICGLNTIQPIDNKINKNKLLYFQASSLIILNAAAAPLHVDGDPKETQEKFEVKLVRKAIHLIQP